MLRIICTRKCDISNSIPGNIRHNEKVRLLQFLGLPRVASGSSFYSTSRASCYYFGVNSNKLSPRGFARVATNVNLERSYHSETGVYGYRPPEVHQFEVPDEALKSRINQSNFWRFVTAYREHAHKKANINPVSISSISNVPELEPRLYGLSENDRFNFTGIISSPASEGSFTDALQFLHKSYSDTMSAEFLYLEEAEEQEWFAQRMEQLSLEIVDHNIRLAIATEMLKSQAFDNFLATKFVTLKRYGGEGAESMMGFYMELLNSASKAGIDQIICGMAHRGRLNLLTGLFKFPPEMLFRKLKGYREFSDNVKASGDIMSHFTSSFDSDIAGKLLHFTMLYNPSHLEAVNPVSMGKTRGRQQSIQDGDYSTDANSRWSDKVINLQVHGDAAFAGQGVNQETLALTTAPHFQVGGSLHLIINNQIGFTTPGERGRSTRYCSDLAKMISAPVVHVNGDCPEEVIKATRLAFEYQRKFRKEVFVDFNCFRQWGHNELDDPTFTNPALYKIINSRRTVPDMYANALIEEGLLTTSDVTNIISKHSNWLDKAWKSVDDYVPEQSYFKRQWTGFSQAPAAITTWDTGVDLNLLQIIGQKSVSFPEDFNIHPHLKKMHVNGRLRKLADGSSIDWATAEALALGSLLYQGFNVRLSGQDVGRGTFSHRHMMLVDQKTNNIFIPLNSLDEAQIGKLEVANSILSEEAVLGFEYGMSIESPNNLIIWEAQFGDFFNGAQIQIDTYITSGEAKWMTCSGLVMLLPHGYDGAGPEHSSCRLERFLQLSDSSEVTPDGEDVNIHVANPTTPGQYFHLLRRQMIRNYRKPLIIVGPKTLLRLNDAASSLSEMGPQTTFAPVIGDKITEPHRVQKVIFVSGKHYYALDRHRQVEGINDVAVIRLEELSPFPTQCLQQEIAKYKNAKVFIWSQEEHQNMGAWSFVKTRFENLVGRRLRYVGRTPAAAPAVGIGQLHQQENQDIVTRPFNLK